MTTQPLLFHAGSLHLDGKPILGSLPTSAAAEVDPLGIGQFLLFKAEQPAARQVFPLGQFPDGIRFTACHRYEPYWMKAAAGTSASIVPVETQSLLVQLESGVCVLLIPLLDGLFRAVLQGNAETGLELVVESGDPSIAASEFTGLFVAAGDDPYALMPLAARSVMTKMKTGRLRTEKTTPKFVDLFGWCTWDAFYQEVSHDKIRAGLESFAAGGVQPGVLIVDDGWQSERKRPSGEQALTAFEANDKFPGDLAPTVAMAKNEFGVQEFIVWHALNGYWGGVDGDAMPGYGVRPTKRRFSPGIHHYLPEFDSWWGGIVGLVPAEHIYRFYQDYHRHLRRQGVDGVKVDTQSTIEGIAAGYGGRVELMRRYHEALEGSVQTHFQGELINCMSCASEMIYSTLNSTVTRTSTDFWPDRPASHGLHLYVNAQVSLWFGEFVQPDWDMFQSGHAMGPYHAAGRAVGGCPVYVSDKPGAHNFELLKQLAMPDGTVLRANMPGVPTLDCLFHDPTSEPVLLKILNGNEGSAVIGAFNCRGGEPGAETEPIAGTIRPGDAMGLDGDRFAVYAHRSQELRVLDADEGWEITLAELEWEVFTIVPIEDGIAPIGLPEMLNSGGAIAFKECESDIYDPEASYIVEVRAGRGPLLVWCHDRPIHVQVDGDDSLFDYNESTHALTIGLPAEAVTAWVSIQTA